MPKLISCPLCQKAGSIPDPTNPSKLIECPPCGKKAREAIGIGDKMPEGGWTTTEYYNSYLRKNASAEADKFVKEYFDKEGKKFKTDKQRKKAMKHMHEKKLNFLLENDDRFKIIEESPIFLVSKHDKIMEQFTRTRDTFFKNLIEYKTICDSNEGKKDKDKQLAIAPDINVFDKFFKYFDELKKYDMFDDLIQVVKPEEEDDPNEDPEIKKKRLAEEKYLRQLNKINPAMMSGAEYEWRVNRCKEKYMPPHMLNPEPKATNAIEYSNVSEMNTPTGDEVVTSENTPSKDTSIHDTHESIPNGTIKTKPSISKYKPYYQFCETKPSSIIEISDNTE